MKKSLVLAMAMALGVTASAYAANPFSDVPAGHWAYDSIEKLAAAGVIEGYGDSTFGGDKLMTRYEMAQIVAKAMARGANVDKLAAEFADELDTLGVRVANLEKKADNVKITGEARYRYYSYDRNNGRGDQERNVLRTRIWVAGQVNDDWTYTAMLENVQTIDNNSGDETTNFQRAYVNGRIGGIKVLAGRYNFTDMNGAMIQEDRVDGVELSYGKDVKIKVAAAKGSDKSSSDADDYNAEDMYYAELTGKIGVVDAGVGYYKFKEQEGLNSAAREDNEIWAVKVALPVAKDLKLTGNYLMTDYDKQGYDDDGYMVGLQYKGAKASAPGSWGLWATYYDMARGTYVSPTFDADISGLTGGFKGYAVGADYTFAKNIVGVVRYFDLDAKEGSNEDKTLYAHLNFLF